MIENDPQNQPGVWPHVFGAGYRPFFLLAAISAALMVPIWLARMNGNLPSYGYFYGVHWHMHELLFGYTVAVIAGFLLTAVPNWTGQPGIKNRNLALLVALWLIGRLILLPPTPLPVVVIALTDMAFLPALGIAIARPLLRGGQLRNAMFLFLIGLLTLANLCFHLEVADVTRDGAALGLRLGLGVILLIIVIIGGRIIPGFTRNGVLAKFPDAPAKIRSWSAIETLSLLSAACFVPFYVAFPFHPATAGLALAVAGFNAVRFLGWDSWSTRNIPLLWILHLGYLWLIIGFALLGLSILQPEIATSAGIHALTAGSIGTMTLGMMSRVALGHSGRPLETSSTTVVAYLLLTAAAIVRVYAALDPNWYSLALSIAGGCWSAAFVLYLKAYWEILTE
jgi:uncharacterized protein involved in response to NO